MIRQPRGVDLFLGIRPTEVFKIADKIKAASGKEYEIGDRVASGGNAVVHKCVESTTGEEYAIKIQLSLSARQSRRFLREVELLKQIRHEQLVSYIDHGDVTANFLQKRMGSGGTVRRNERLMFLIMPLADSNLIELLRRGGPPLYEDYIGQFKGLASALSALHDKALHRDIKPENILVRGETWMISDFGLCRFHESDEEITKDHEGVGPRYWMSPEAINKAIGNDDDISKASDVFQLCSIFWFVVTGRHPSGCVRREDWTGPSNIFNVLFDALAHDDTRRPLDGKKLGELLHEATVSLHTRGNGVGGNDVGVNSE